MLAIPGLPEPVFPCDYEPNFLNTQEADALFNRFNEWLYCGMVNSKSGLTIKRKGVSFASDINHSQVRGTYDDVFTFNKADAEDHCDGPVLPLDEAPEEILNLQRKLEQYLRTMPGLAKWKLNYLSVMKYVDHTVGIDWHKHSEDDGCDTPTFIISTGADRPFHVGLINKTKPPKPTEYWSRTAEHGSLIVIPASFNDTHWHAILPDKHPCGIRISVNTKCLRTPRVFSIYRRRYPRFAKYVGCKKGGFEGTIYGNDFEPMKGHFRPLAYSEDAFRQIVEYKMSLEHFREQAIKDLRGKHLLCWCIQDGPNKAPFCHARVWLDVVNSKKYEPTSSATGSASVVATGVLA
jgi:hypothetical protein